MNTATAAVLATAILTFLITPGVHADPKTCVPAVSGVPGMSGPPKWWDTSDAYYTQFGKTLGDPRWRGAASHGTGDNGGNQVEFRALQYNDGRPYLLLSWYVKVTPDIVFDDPSMTDPRLRYPTRLYVGFNSNNTAASTSHVIVLSLKLDPGNFDPQGSAAYDLTYLQGTGSSAITQTAPAWMTTDTRVWVDGSSTNRKWAVQMRIPIDASINNGLPIANLDSFYGWYYLQTTAYLGDPSDPSDPNNQLGVIPYTWPKTQTNQTVDYLAAPVQGSPTSWVIPNATGWAEFAAKNPSTDPTCQNGIALTYTNVGNNLGSADPSQIHWNDPNVFFAVPHNNSSTAYDPTNPLKATFRFANWGSQIGVVTGGSWQENPSVPPATVTGVNGNDITLQTAPPWIPASEVDPTNPNFNYVCSFIGRNGSGPPGNIPGNASCNNVDPTRSQHQCVLVTLEGNYKFENSSVYRNMNFVNASTFTRQAEVSVKGLAAMPNSPQRDVFLYVDKRNMAAYPRMPNPPEIFSRTKDGEMQFTARDATHAPTAEGTAADPNLAGPTYIVHAYHDTGATLPTGGSGIKILQPQTVHGYYVSHNGDLFGWQDELSGASVQRISANFYKVAVPNNGAETIHTVIEAREHAYAVIVKGGVATPQNDLSGDYKGGLSLGLTLEYLIKNYISADLIVGSHHFKDHGAGSDLDVTQYSLNARFYFGIFGGTFFLTGGSGKYSFDPGSTQSGYNLGAGYQYEISPRAMLELTTEKHTMTGTANADLGFGSTQFGIRYMF